MKKNIRIPKGVKVFLPEEAKKKRYLENKIRNIFELWGYEEVITPTFEFFESLTIGAGDLIKNNMYKILDRSGQILALRSDMTTPVARLIASMPKSFDIPIRVYYLSNIFRYEELQTGKSREFYQAGVELIGYSYPKADAEVISLLSSLLEGVGIKDFKIDLGQVNLYKSIIKDANISEVVERNLRSAIHKKNLGEVESLLLNIKLKDKEKEAIVKLTNSYSKDDSILNSKELVINKEGEAALENLGSVYDILKSYGLKNKIIIDLGILRSIDYYTGLVFEAFVPNVGYSICGGGRYDNLIAQFGTDLPATGFAVGIERLFLALSSEDIFKEIKTRKKYLIICCREDSFFLKIAYDLANNLRKKEVWVEIALEAKNEEDILNYVRKKNIEKTIFIGLSEEEVKIVDYFTKKEEILNIIDILAEE
ncbi:MAG: ATP phosphoribosyltransferase regulatory subunit [bacterium]|nr:ATP phosphoribosyltransferase regulatory subunit [bacterium]